VEQFEVADKVERAVHKTLTTGLTITGDLGGHASTTEFTKAVISNL
jgi:isocitrate/isopropylmalate dehydrogenase